MPLKPHEIAYLEQADLGRLATLQRNGTLQNSPVGFGYNAELSTIDIAGYRMGSSQKFRNIAHHDTVAFVVDDIASRDPWRVRCLEIRGRAAQVGHGDSALIRITPERVISFGIDDTDTPPHELAPDIRDV